MKHLWQYFHTVCICFSAFYRTKLLSWILTLVNFASERNKTLFSGGNRREAWETPPPYFQINQRAPGTSRLSNSSPPPPTLFQGPDDLGPLLSHLLLGLLWFRILYSIFDILGKEFFVDHST